MKFTVERLALVKMIKLLAGKPAHAKQSDPWMCLTACGSRVFVEANETICGVEALVMSEGSCRIERVVLLKFLKSYHPRPNVTVEARPGALQLVNSTVPINGFTTEAVAPDKLQSFAVTRDAWRMYTLRGHRLRFLKSSENGRFPLIVSYLTTQVSRCQKRSL
ncbi:MAG: hypothetical protein EXS31_05735 [Pedosphaera sp.]|nr:hypothetical protein [Pedosphaera sp.]